MTLGGVFKQLTGVFVPPLSLWSIDIVVFDQDGNDVKAEKLALNQHII